MTHPLCYVRFGSVQVEWNENGDMSLVRQDNAQAIHLSLSEWTMLLRVAELRGWPVAPPRMPQADTSPA